MSEDKAKKLAAEVRSATESTSFDLAGYGPQGCEAIVSGGLSAPLPLKHMVRLSFIVGGGKKVRQKYGDALLGVLTEALKSGGYVEDKGAALSLDSAGTFKYQHNTDTDLKHVHVYPKIDPSLAASDEAAASDALSHSELILFAEAPICARMLAAKCPTFAQKRAAMEVLKAARVRHAAIEAKLASMEALDEGETRFYENVDADALKEKQEALSAVLEQIVDSGKLNAAELKMVRRQLDEKREALEAQIADAQSEGKEKRAAKLSDLLEELKGRIAKAEGVKPIVHTRKHAAEIAQITKRLKELSALEGSKKVLPLDEVQKLSAKPKLVEDLARLDAESRGWFPEAIV